jgi:CPA2 family monovalent cation:H+ antiporter-2
MHDLPLLTTLAAAFGAAWALGLVTQRLGMSPIVGYLLAGVSIGPHTPGFVADVTLAPQLAEIGVILLMFGVGLHFHLADLVAVRSIAIPGAIVQSAVATLAGVVIFSWFGWPFSAGLVMGMAMAVASTVVLIRVLVDNDQLNTNAGHAAMGWLIVEDIFTVIILVMIPALAGAGPVGDDAHAPSSQMNWIVSLAVVLGKLTVMVIFLYVAGSRVVPWILTHVARGKSRELFTLTVLVLSIAVATGASALFGASVALGAFLAGMVVGQSPVSQQAGIDVLPLRDAFAVLFFVAVGMLLDPAFLLEKPQLVLAGLMIVMIAKPLAALAIVAILGHPARTGLTIAVGLAQIGEFSFIVGELARKHGIAPDAGMNVLVAASMVSIVLNPILFRAIDPAEAWLRRRPFLWNLMNGRSDRRACQLNAQAAELFDSHSDDLAIVVGYGPVGQHVDRLLREAAIQTVVIDLNIDTVARLRADGRLAIYGDAMRLELLKQAGLARASHLVWTTPHLANYYQLVQTVRDAKPTIRLLIRSRYLREAADIRRVGADVTVVDEIESAVALTQHVLAETKADADRVRAEIDCVRQQLTKGSFGADWASA